jgi:hypothetical protein
MALHDAAQPLLASGILTPGTIAALETKSLVATLSQPLVSQALDSSLVRYTADTVIASVSGWPIGGAKPEPPPASDVSALIRALYACPWMPDPHATALPIVARYIANGLDEEGLPELPRVAAIADLRERFGGQVVDRAVSAWIGLVRPNSTDLKHLVPRVIAAGPSNDLLDAVAKSVESLDSKDRLGLLASVIDDPNAAVPAPPALTALGIHLIPDIEVARLVGRRYAGCGNNSQRRQVLRLWEHCSIGADSARRHLVEKVLIPLFVLNSKGGNSQAADFGLEYLLRLASPVPSGVKKALGDAVVGATRGRSGERRGADALASLGYKVRKTGLFRRRPEVDTGAS